MLKKLFFLVVFLFPVMIFSQEIITTKSGKNVLLYKNRTWKNADEVALLEIKPVRIDKLEIPATAPSEKILTHTGYAFCYVEKYEQSKWVAYELTAKETKKVCKRSNKFTPDPVVSTGTACDADYLKSGYDRGHLAPAADMSWSNATMKESFYYSNMSPQVPAFNRGIWKQLEEQVRQWAIENHNIYIVTGPVLKDGLPSIGKNKVAVPEAYYKVILDYSEPEIKAIGFIIPNRGSDKALQDFAVSVDSVETVTGIDFFPKLPDNHETVIEKSLCRDCWSW